MVTRFLTEVQPVTALDALTLHSCTVSGFTCTCAGPVNSAVGTTAFAGRIIDRLGLSRRYQAVILAPMASANIATSVESTGHLNYFGVAVGIQHSATTCSGDFTDLSTGEWPSEQALQAVSTATSTSGPWYSAAGAIVSQANAGLLTTGLTSSTSTGYAAFVGYQPMAVGLTAAKRFVRIVVQPHIEATGCGAPTMTLAGSLLFGYPEEAPSTGPLGRVFVTSACSS